CLGSSAAREKLLENMLRGVPLGQFKVTQLPNNVTTYRVEIDPDDLYAEDNASSLKVWVNSVVGGQPPKKWWLMLLKKIDQRQPPPAGIEGAIVDASDRSLLDGASASQLQSLLIAAQDFTVFV